MLELLMSSIKNPDVHIANVQARVLVKQEHQVNISNVHARILIKQETSVDISSINVRVLVRGS